MKWQISLVVFLLETNLEANTQKLAENTKILVDKTRTLICFMTKIQLKQKHQLYKVGSLSVPMK